MGRGLGMLIALGGTVFAAAGAVFVGLLMRQSAGASMPVVQPTPITLPVVVTTRALPVQALLKADDLMVVQMPVEFVPLEAAGEVSEVVGTITMVPLASGEMLMRHHLADPTHINRNVAFILDEEQVVLAFPATDLMSQADVLQPGDRVDILVSVKAPVQPVGQSAVLSQVEEAAPEEALFTFTALQGVSISAMVVEVTEPRETRVSGSSYAASSGTPAPTPTPGPEAIEAQAILLALDPQDALVLKHLKDAGGIIDIVLRAPTASQNFAVEPVSAEYLKDRYELVISR